MWWYSNFSEVKGEFEILEYFKENKKFFVWDELISPFSCSEIFVNVNGFSAFSTYWTQILPSFSHYN